MAKGMRWLAMGGWKTVCVPGQRWIRYTSDRDLLTSTFKPRLLVIAQLVERKIVMDTLSLEVPGPIPGRET